MSIRKDLIQVNNSLYSIVDHGTEVSVLRARGRETKHIKIIKYLHTKKGLEITAKEVANEGYCGEGLALNLIRGIGAEKKGRGKYLVPEVFGLDRRDRNE